MASPSARSDVDAARRLLAAALGEASALLPTPLTAARSLAHGQSDAYLKIETGLPTGSFKIRGAVYSLAVNVARQPIGEVAAASTGNHGAAVAYAGRLLGIRATIFLPRHPNEVKAARIRALDARIIETGGDLAEAIDAARLYCERRGAFFLHDAADPDVPIGAGTIGAEILEQLPAADVVFVPMGDTALVRGVAAALKAVKPDMTVVGAVAAGAPAYALAWQSGKAIETSTADTIADGLAVRRPLAPNVEAIRALVDEVVLVSEREMLDAIEWLSAREGVEAEAAGAAATAAFLQRTNAGATTASRAASRANAVLLVTGANASPETTRLLAARRQRGPVPPP